MSYISPMNNLPNVKIFTSNTETAGTTGAVGSTGTTMFDNITLPDDTITGGGIDYYDYTFPKTDVGSIPILDDYAISIGNYQSPVSDLHVDGDITIKGKSLSDMLSHIEDRLAILHPNSELESRWEKLKSLGEQYRQLEKEIIEQEKMWNILKK